MLSINKIESKKYYIDLAREDYYLKGGEPPGKWHGQGAAALGQNGLVSDGDFHQVIEGFRPGSGEKLVQNAGDKKRTPGWDLTFSAPKTVSTVWSQADETTRHKIQQCQEIAVRKTLDWIETQTITRRGKGGAIKEPAQLIVATFEHGTSRTKDPQLHTHCLVMNAAVRADGTTGAIESRQFYQNKMAAGALYRAELAKQLGEQLGYRIERTGQYGNLFEIKGVAPALVEEFSKRRQEIEAALEAKGYTSAKASEMAALDTRHHKGHVARKELFDEWQTVGRAFGYRPPSVGYVPSSETVQQNRRREMLDQALTDLTARESTFTERDLIRKLAESAPGTDQGMVQLRQLATEGLSSETVVSLGRIKEEPRYTTRELLALEQRMLATVQQAAQRRTHRVGDRTLTKTLQRYPTLREEQETALRYLADDHSAIKTVEGWAGTGKTFMLKAAREMWEADGYTVYGAALAAKAADGLQQGAGIESQTLHRLLYRLDKGNVALNRRSVVVVDEAAMIGTRQLARLITATESAGAKLVLVGDTQQLQSIETGGGFKKIGEMAGRAELTHITRQTIEWMRKAVVDMIHGDAASVLKDYANHSRLTVQETWRDARQALIERWRQQALHSPESHLILAGKNLDVLELNKQAQGARQAAGLLGKSSIKVRGQTFHPNDRVIFTKNNVATQLKNGQAGTVKEVSGNSMTVWLDNGLTKQIDTTAYDHMQLGYATTTHKAQGDTKQHCYVLVGGQMQDQELSYVQLSRSKQDTWLFTDRMEAGDELGQLARRMAISHQKELAASYLPVWQTPQQHTR